MKSEFPVNLFSMSDSYDPDNQLGFGKRVQYAIYPDSNNSREEA